MLGLSLYCISDAITFELCIECLLFDTGRNNWGQLGVGHTSHIGDDANEMGNYLEVTNLGDFIPVRIECGGEHSCALSQEGYLKCWGMNVW